MKKKRKIAHIYPSPFTHESRIEREITTLREAKLADNIFVLATSKTGLPNQEVLENGFVHVYRYNLESGLEHFGRFARLVGLRLWSDKVAEFLINEKDIVLLHCHSLSALPLAVRVKKRTGASILYDAHEIESERAGANWVRRILSRYYERLLLAHVDEMWVVGDEIRNWYQQVQKIKPNVIYNYPLVHSDLRLGEAANASFREIFGIPNSAIVYLYHGYLGRGRGIEELISWFQDVNDKKAHMVFMGDGQMAGAVQRAAEMSTNIHLHPPVAPVNLLEFASTADVGICFIQPISLSYKYCLPNKLFEYIQAGLAVLVSDLPEMRRIITQTGCGFILSDKIEKKDAISWINRTTMMEVTHWKKAAVKHRDQYNWKRLEPKIIEAYSLILNKKKL